MNKKITPQQTKELFRFCHKHYVYQYDVQVELVDHLASSIEEQWENDSKIPFEVALKNIFKKFGITGFDKFKTQKQKALEKKYNRLLWTYLLEFFRWPKMLMTLAFTLMLFTLLQIVENDLWIIIPYFSFLTIGVFVYYFKIFPKKYKIKTKPGKSFLLLNRLKKAQLSAILTMQIPIQGVNFFGNGLLAHWMENPMVIFICSFLIITLTMVLAGELFYIPQKIKKHFMEQFGEFAV